MEQRDFLKREIDLLGQVLSKMVTCLLGLKSGDVSTVGAEVVNQTLKKEVDLDLEELLWVEADHLIDYLIVDKGFREGNLDQLTSILLLLAEDMTGENPQRDALYNRCLVLCDYLETTQRTLSFDRYSKLEQIKAHLL